MRRRLRALAAILVAGLLASACIVVPRRDDGFDPDCRIVTHHMRLDVVQVGQVNGCGSTNQDCLAALGVAAVSAVVSGSIVVVGNMVYWAEQRSGCMLTSPAPAPASAPMPARPGSAPSS